MIKKILKKIKRAYLVYNFERYIKAGNYSHPSPKYKALNRLNTQKFWKRVSDASKRAFERMVKNTEMQLFGEPVLGAKVNKSISFKKSCTLDHEADACRYLFKLDYEKKAIDNHMAPSGIEKVFPEVVWKDELKNLQESAESYTKGSFVDFKSNVLDFEEGEG